MAQIENLMQEHFLKTAKRFLGVGDDFQCILKEHHETVQVLRGHIEKATAELDGAISDIVDNDC